MKKPSSHFDDHFMELVDQATDLPLSSEEATTAIKNLKTFSECRPPADPEPEPTHLLGKLRFRAARVWDNETTRVLIKAGGAFAGVAAVTWTTVHKDHVIERQAIAQANQRPS